MNQSPRTTYIYHSSFLFIPLIGTLLYQIQIYLFDKGLLGFIYISRRKQKLQKKLIKNITSKSSEIIVKTYKFSRLLRNINIPITLDLELANYKNLKIDQLYALMWSLVYVSFVTHKTKISLGNFLPKNFPVKKTIVIPYNDSFDLVCDYIFQTAKVLANKGNSVYLIALANPISLLKYLLLKAPIKSKRQEFFDKNNIIVVNPLTLFPLRLTKYKVVEKVNRYLTLLYTTHFIKKVSANYLWCFDPADIRLVKLSNKFAATIYDCVDYFSTLDPKLDRKIKINEIQLINSVNFFFVNSHALEKRKGKIRKPTAVVPQGFDFEAFTTKKTLTDQEKKEIESLKKVFKKIPRPRIGLVGSLTYRLDFKLLSTLIKIMPDVSFVFTNAFLPMPHDDRFIGTKKLLKQIRQAHNAYLVPKTLNRRIVKEILEQFNIGIIPYDTSFDFNRYCYPMKLFEYFYMGKPVVSTPIEELKAFPTFVKIGNTAEEWEKYIRDLLLKPWPINYNKKQRFLAENNSWEKKIEAIYNQV